MGMAFVLTAAWWLALTLPLLRVYRQKHFIEAAGHPVKGSFRNLGRVFTLR